MVPKPDWRKRRKCDEAGGVYGGDALGWRGQACNISGTSLLLPANNSPLEESASSPFQQQSAISFVNYSHIVVLKSVVL